MSFTLRDYQLNHNKSLSVALRDKEHILAQAPGGTGKTKQFVSIAWSAAQKGSCVLIITDRIKVYRQNIREAKAIGINPDTPSDIKIQLGAVYVAMAQTILSRIHLLDQFNSLPKKVITLIDEAHGGIFNTILDTLHNRLTIGFTATPHYKWAKHLPKYYNDCITSEQIDWFIQNDWLCTNQHIARGKKEMEDALTKSNTGEYTESSQENWFSQSGLYDGLLDDIRSEIGKFTKAMVFCASIKSAEATFNFLIENGIKCCIGHSKRKDETEQLKNFEDLNSGFDILVSVSSFATGYDFPAIDLLFLYRAFGSFILYMQSLFRGNRKKPSMTFKSYDYGDNWRRHGLYYFDRDWNTLWKAEEKKKDKDALGNYTIKECANCGSIISLMARICQYCNEVQPENEQELKQGVLLDITAQYQKLVGRKLSSLTAQELSVYAKIKQKLQFAIRIAKSNRQRALKLDPNTKDNFLRDFGNAMGYSDKWYNVQSAILKKEKSDIFFTDITLK